MATIHVEICSLDLICTFNTCTVTNAIHKRNLHYYLQHHQIFVNEQVVPFLILTSFLMASSFVMRHEGGLLLQSKGSNVNEPNIDIADMFEFINVQIS